MFYADPAADATGAARRRDGRPKPRLGYFPIFPSSWASSGNAW
jgi:hypothetical protein